MDEFKTKGPPGSAGGPGRNKENVAKCAPNFSTHRIVVPYIGSCRMPESFWYRHHDDAITVFRRERRAPDSNH